MVIERNKRTRGWCATFKKGDKLFYGDLSYVPYCGAEFMAFPCDENGEVTSWCEEFRERPDRVDEETFRKCVEHFLNDKED